MNKAFFGFILSAGIGLWLSFFNMGMGPVAAISIIGSIIIYQNEERKNGEKENEEKNE